MPIRCSRLHDLLVCRSTRAIDRAGASRAGASVVTPGPRVTRQRGAPWPLAALAGPFLALSAPQALADTAPEGFALPTSGLQVLVQEIIWDHDDTTGRFRFIAPELASVLHDDETLAEDFMLLCNDFARPIQRAIQPDWALLVLSIGGEATVFGEYDPAVLQVFEGFEIDADGCTWETF